jgi:hypothetical protein
MIQKPLDQIEKVDIDALIANQVREGKTIEYKESLPGGADAERKEFLADVSSFANAAGGDILFGVEEERDSGGKTTGLPARAPGLLGVNADQVTRMLESVIRDGIAPRIPGVRVQPVAGFEQGPVLVIRVPKSWSAPHMITFKDWCRFYSRNSAGKQLLAVDEIRSAFALSESLGEWVRQFRAERIARIVADETPVPLGPGAKVVLHVLPVEGLAVGAEVDAVALGDACTGLPALARYPHDGRLNFEGYLEWVRSTKSDKWAEAYLQLFRSGAIEAVDRSLAAVKDDQGFLNPAYEVHVVDALRKYLVFERNIGRNPPLVVMLSLIGAKGHVVCTPKDAFVSQPVPIDRDVLSLPDLLVDTLDVDAAAVLKPAFDVIQQTVGRRGSPFYDHKGAWIESEAEMVRREERIRA